MLVFAVNSLHYLNQSFPSVDVSLNSITDNSTNVPLSKFSDVYVCVTYLMGRLVLCVRLGGLVIPSIVLRIVLYRRVGLLSTYVY